MLANAFVGCVTLQRGGVVNAEWHATARSVNSGSRVPSVRWETGSRKTVETFTLKSREGG